nr:putative ribonuclease H-like domain-containing protein [Tanacetum cinerariifolium]
MGMKTKMPNSRPCFSKHKYINDPKEGNPQHALKDKGVIDIGCSRHMTRNMSYLSDFEELNGRYVVFGECLVLSHDFKLPDESQVLLRAPRENNMYNVNLKSIVPFWDLTCLFAKAMIDESNLWHRRLGHINFKTINKLVKCNLVRGLPTTLFENDNTCVACKKGKQHKASCKTKPISSVDQPLYRLHMDLFGPTLVKSLNKKSYCLVVTDDYSRFTWVFLLAIKDETSPILKTFITGLENQLRLKLSHTKPAQDLSYTNRPTTPIIEDWVSDLRMNLRPGHHRLFLVLLSPLSDSTRHANPIVTKTNSPIRRHITRSPSLKTSNSPPIVTAVKALVVSVAQGNPQHTLKDKGVFDSGCSRHMTGNMSYLSDFEELNSRYVSFRGNWVESPRPVTQMGGKISGKGKIMIDDYSRFTCVFFLATKDETSPILKTFITGLENQLSLKVKVIRSDNGTEFKNHDLNQFCRMKGIKREFNSLGKFDGKVDEGFIVGYSVNSKAFRVFNSRTHDAVDGKEPDFYAKKPESEVIVSPSSTAQSRKQDDKTKKQAKGKSLIESFTGYRYLSIEIEDCSNNNINEVNVAGTIVLTIGQNSPNNTNTFSVVGPSNAAASPTYGKSSFIDASQLPDDPDIPELEDITYSDDEDDVGAEVDFNNLETSIIVSPVPTIRVHKDHHVSQIIGDRSSTTQIRSMTRVVKDQGGLTKMFNDDFQTCMFAFFLSNEEPKRVHQALKDPSWIEAKPEELLQFKMQKVWVIVDLPHGKRAIGTKWVFRNKKDERGIVIMNKVRLVAQGHTQEEGINYEDVFAPVARIEAIRLFLAYASFRGFMVYQMDIKSAFLYGTTEEEVYVCQPLGFEDPDRPDKVYKVVKAVYGLHQAPTACQDKYVVEILRKFGLTEGKSASTPIDTEKPFLKDPDGKDVDVHTYRSMLGSLMYLTLSRPDIMFAEIYNRRMSIPCMQIDLLAMQEAFIVATSSIEAEYVAAASCCAQVLWI